MNFLIAAISLGFLGSFHCVGMCGPIALSLPVSGTSQLNRIFSALTYNSGRIITYALLGTFFGFIGMGFSLAGFQQVLSVTLGILILLTVVLPAATKNKFRPGENLVYRIVAKIKNTLGSLLHTRSTSALFIIGLLNGLLPCGLVYIAIAGAVATGSPTSGALFMAFFGLGTFPAMFAISILQAKINIEVRRKINRLVPVFISGMAILLILRGLNLGIPYVSPQIAADKHSIQTCCHK